MQLIWSEVAAVVYPSNKSKTSSETPITESPSTKAPIIESLLASSPLSAASSINTPPSDLEISIAH